MEASCTMERRGRERAAVTTLAPRWQKSSAAAYWHSLPETQDTSGSKLYTRPYAHKPTETHTHSNPTSAHLTTPPSRQSPAPGLAPPLPLDRLLVGLTVRTLFIHRSYCWDGVLRGRNRRERECRDGEREGQRSSSRGERNRHIKGGGGIQSDAEQQRQLSPARISECVVSSHRVLLTGLATRGDCPRGLFRSWAWSWMLAPPSEALRPSGPIPFSSCRVGGCSRDCSWRHTHTHGGGDDEGEGSVTPTQLLEHPNHVPNHLPNISYANPYPHTPADTQRMRALEKPS